MNTSTRAAGLLSSLRRRLFKPRVATALLAGIIAAAGIGAMAQNAAAGGWHHRSTHAMSGNPADMASHVDEMLQHIYTETGATDQQKARIAPIVQQAATDFVQLHEQLHDGHAQMLTLLTQETVDRSALETARAAQIDIADEASKRIVQLFADVAEVLTPAQRKALADHVSQHMGFVSG